jgi:PAS domain S-box-containing protein
MVLSLVDVTGHITLQKNIQHAAEEWRTTFDSIRDLISIHDTSYRILRVNKAYAHAFRMRPGQLIGKKCYDVFHSSSREPQECLMKQVIESKKPARREVYEPRLGLHFEITATPILNSDNEVTCTVHAARDITEQKRAEEIVKIRKEALERLVRDKTRELLAAREELENSRRLSDIGVLAATIAHEIRNPLAAIKTATYNIRRKSPTPMLAGHLANIEKKVSESDQIIKNLLSYSRIKQPNYENVRLPEVLSDCISSVSDKYSRWNVSVTRDINVPPDTVIEADPVHLHVLFTNILDNAYQALPGNTGTITVRLASEGAQAYLLRFTDTGIGIPADDLKRILEPFFTRKSKGIGLGLTVCNQIITLHNGTLHIDSTPGKGTAITVRLPVKRSLP